MKTALLFSIVLATTALHADITHLPVAYELDGTKFAGSLVYGNNASADLPGILMVPNWMGPDTEGTLEKAKEMAGDDFAVFVVDMYGIDVRPSNGAEAGQAAGFVRADRALMRARALKSIEVFNQLAEEHPIDTGRTLAIGFCFGGGTVLELARSGTESIKGVVSFHGDLISPTLEADAGQVKIPQLVLHGADDPYVPQEDVQAYIAAMQSAKVESWTLVQFSNTVHSFTDPTAQSEGARYHKRSAERAFEMMDDFADEVLGLDD